MNSTPAPALRILLSLAVIAFSIFLVTSASASARFERWLAAKARLSVGDAQSVFWRFRRTAQVATGVVFLLLGIAALVAAVAAVL